MSFYSRTIGQLYPWRVAAVAIAVLALAMSLTGRAEAAIGVTVTVNDNVAGNQTDLTIDITLDFDLNFNETITVTLPAGWTVANGDLTGSVSWSALQDVAPTITGNAAARTITTTTAAGQMAALPGLQMTISPGADITNPAAPAAGVTITVDADGGNAQGTSAPFNIVAPAASAAITGTVQGGANAEGDIVTGGGTIIVTLTGDTWVAAGATFDGQRQNIINGIDSAGAEGAGWDAVVKAGLAVGDVVRTSATVVTVTLPAFAGYNISANETITVTIPGTALTGAAPLVAAPTFNILAASAAVTGTIQGGSNAEADIATGGETIIITLTNDTWVAAGATFDAQRQNIINGIDSAGAEGTGWDAVVKAGLAVTDVVRTSATAVTVTLPAFGTYNISANETITVTIPATAIASAGALTAAPTFTITAAVAVSAAVTGTIQAGTNAEANIVTGGGTIIITLTNDTWVAAGGVFDGQRQNIINGIDSASAEGTGWDAVVKAGLAVGDVVRTSATVVTVTLPAFAGYNITANETITVTIPGTALTGAAPVVAAPTFTITFTAPPAPPVVDSGPVSCYPGKFSSTGFEPCTPAPAGSFAAGYGAKSATLCAPGSFSSIIAAPSCTLAPIGSFVATEGATSATACVPPATTEALGATECIRAGQVSNVSFSTTNYEAGRFTIWTVDFTTSKTGALGPGDTITITMPGLTMSGGDFGRSGGFIGDATPNSQGSTITLTIKSGSAPASTAGSVRIIATNPSARTINASSLKVVTSKDTVVAEAKADVVITPKPGPKLTALVVAPQGLTSFAELILVELVDGQTTYTVDVPVGKRYFVQGESKENGVTENDVTHFFGSTPVDPGVRTYNIGESVTIRVKNAAGATTDYTVTLRARPIGPPAKLVFVTSPAGAVANTAFTTQPRVEVQDANGQTTASTDLMHLAIKPGTGTPGASLSCVYPSGAPDALRAVAGVGTFAGCKIDRPGTGYVLVAREGTPLTFLLGTSVADDLGAAPLTVGESEPFDVTGGTAVTAVTISASPRTAGAATTITTTFRATTALVAADSITVKMTGYTFPVGSVTVTNGIGITGTLTGTVTSDARDTVVIRGGAVVAGTQLTLTFPATNPGAGVIAATALTVQTSKDVTPVTSSAGFTITRAGITGVRFSPSATTADAAIDLTVEFTTPRALATGYAITLGVTDFVVPTSGLTVSASSGFSTGTTYAVSSTAANRITITITGTAPANARLSLTVSGTGLKNPATAKTIAKAGLTVSTTADTTPVASSNDIVIRATVGAITSAVVTLSNAIPGATSVTTTITFTTPVAIPAAGKIVVELPGFTWPATPSASFTAPAATAAPASAAFASNRLTITNSAGQIPAGTVTLRVTGATNPAAQPARTNVVMRTTTSADVTLAETSGGTLVAISAPQLVVTLTVPSTVSASNSSVVAVASVSGAGGQTIRYSWRGEGAGCESLELRDSNSAVWRLDVTGPGNSCTITVTATAGSESARAQAIVRVAAAQPRLEFVTQPSDSTTGVADINVRVRAVKADGTTDTAFNNRVQLTIQGGGSPFVLGSVTAVNGVATFTRTYNPSRADTTWALRATQISGRAAGVYAPATSDSFRVTKQPTLRFTTQPVGGTAGAALTTQPVVTAYKADGTVDTAFTGTVTLTLKADTANGAVLTSTATAAVAGRATFTGTSVNNAGTDYVLVASATGYTSVTSESFDITGAATRIVITQYPSTFAVGRDYTIEVRAEARDAEGRAVPGAASQLGLLLNGNSTTQRIATTPTAVENGVAIFRATHRFASAGEYRWGVDHVGGSRNLPQADSEAFTVAKPASKLVFVVQPGGFGSVLGTQPVVEIQDADGNRVPGATNEVTLTFLATNDTDPIMTGGARRAATAGQVKYTAVGFTGGTARPGATFTITASATGLTSATSASFGPAGPTTKLAFTSDLPCGLVARPGCSPAAREGQQFTITVAAQDASGQVNTNENGLATLTGDGNSGMTAKSAPFVNGVATFTGVKFTSASTTGYTLTATAGALTVASGRIVVTQDNTPASLRFIAAPTHEVTGVNFATQPVVEVYNAAGRRITDVSGNIVLRLRKQDGTTTSLLEGTASSATGSGVARFPGLRVTGADTNLYLTATLEGTTLEATQTGTFRVYATAAEATTAQANGQTQTKPFSLSFNLACTGATTCQQAVQADICKSLKLDTTGCARITVTSVSSSSIVIEITDASLISTANVEVIDGQEIITLGGVDLTAFQAEFGAQPPTGTSVLYAVARIAYDEYGNRLEELSGPQSFSLPVPESVLLPGARPGDLKVAWWDGEQWVQVPTRAVVEEDGSFRVTATTSQLGAFAVLYAPGASRIETSGIFSANGVGSGVFVGGSTSALAHAAGLNGATTLWVQDASGTFRVLVIGGPAFLVKPFASRFANGFAGPTAVTLIRASASPVTSRPSGTTSTPTSPATASATTHIVAPGETLSKIGALYGVEWMRIAEANGISGPAYRIRDGLVLTIPA